MAFTLQLKIVSFIVCFLFWLFILITDAFFFQGLEKLPEEPPLFKYHGVGRDLLIAPSDVPIFISVRRSIPVQISKSNGDKYVTIMTSEGTQEIPLREYYRFVEKMKPDVVFAIPDLPTFNLQQRQEHFVNKNMGKKAIKTAANFVPKDVVDKKDEKEHNQNLDINETSNDDKNPRVRTKPFVRTAIPKIGEDLATGLIPKAGGNRVKKMVSRTTTWMKGLIDYYHDSSSNSKLPALFAPMLPYVDLRTQGPYLDYIQNLHKSQENIAGITLWSYFGNDTERVKEDSQDQVANDSLWKNVRDMLEERGLNKLIRYSNAPMETPQDILDMIMKSGADLFNGDLVAQYTDAGVVLDFVFPVDSGKCENAMAGLSLEKKGIDDKATSTITSIGMNMWDEKYSTDMSRLGNDTPNVTGTHNRAYIHHLLDAHEMTAWVILQMHNMHVFQLFFQGIRQVLEKSQHENDTKNGINCFEEEVARFKAKYGDRLSALNVKEFQGKRGVANITGGRFDSQNVDSGIKNGLESEAIETDNTGTKEEADLKKSRYPKARTYALKSDELTERTRGTNVGQKLNETRWSKDLEENSQ